MLGDVAAGIGLVARGAEAAGLQVFLDAIHQPRRAADAVEIADHHVGAALAGIGLMAAADRRHRMTVEQQGDAMAGARFLQQVVERVVRSEEHTSELQSLMRISYSGFCLKKTK